MNEKNIGLMSMINKIIIIIGKQRFYNICDVLICTTATVLVSFVLPFMFSCQINHEICGFHPQRCITFNCTDNSFNSLATLLFTQPNSAIRALYERSLLIDAQISWSILLIFCISYFLLCCLSYNMAVPGGLFIPSIIIGASYGRIMGIAMQSLIQPPTDDPELGINPGVYAVLGSVSMLGGMTRMTLPITVMMIEITSDAQFVLPIMLVVLLAKGTADRIIGGLYAEHLRLDGILMVFADKLPKKLKRLNAKDIMSQPPLIHLSVISQVNDCYKSITETKHHAFPVVQSQIANVTRIRRRQYSTKTSTLNHSTSNDILHNDSNNNVEMQNLNSRSSSISNNNNSITQQQPQYTGALLGLIQRRHLMYALANRPCFTSAIAARDAEPSTTTLLDNINSLQQNNNNSNGIHNALSANNNTQSVQHTNRQPSQQSTQHNTNNNKPYNSSQLYTSISNNSINNDSNNNTNQNNNHTHSNHNNNHNNNQLYNNPTSELLSAISASMIEGGLTPVGHSAMMDALPLLAGSKQVVRNLDVQEDLLDNWINLSPFIDTGAYIVSQDTSARRVWALFRSLGMRHIVVVNELHQPVGMITRHDLIKYSIG